MFSDSSFNTSESFSEIPEITFKDKLESVGMGIAGFSIDDELVEIIEIPKHPWFVGCQFHPEFTSTPRDGHPLFASFIEAASKFKESRFRVHKNVAV